MKVWFDGPSAVEHPKTGTRIEPGENDFPDETGRALIEAGVCRPLEEGRGQKRPRVGPPTPGALTPGDPKTEE